MGGGIDAVLDVAAPRGTERSPAGDEGTRVARVPRGGTRGTSDALEDGSRARPRPGPGSTRAAVRRASGGRVGSTAVRRQKAAEAVAEDDPEEEQVAGQE